MINNYTYDVGKSFNNPNGDKTFAKKVQKYNYSSIYSKYGLTKQTITKDNRTIPKKHNNVSLFSITMGQVQHFKFSINCLMIDPNMSSTQYGPFLPIKSIEYRPVSVESTKLSVGIFADFPIFHQKRLGSIKVVMYDNDTNDYERAVKDWFSGCFDDENGFVRPMDEIVQEATYKEFTNEGKLSRSYYFEVIPDGDVTVNRSYENSALKEISFNVLIVGSIVDAISDANIVYQQQYEFIDDASVGE